MDIQRACPVCIKDLGDLKSPPVMTARLRQRSTGTTCQSQETEGFGAQPNVWCIAKTNFNEQSIWPVASLLMLTMVS